MPTLNYLKEEVLFNLLSNCLRKLRYGKLLFCYLLIISFQLKLIQVIIDNVVRK